LHQWKWEGVVGTQDTVGVAPIGMWFETNLPDSNGTDGQRVAFRMEWSRNIDAADTTINNAESSLLQLYEDGANEGIVHYDFRRDKLRLNPAVDETQKGLMILTGDGGFTNITNNGTTSSQFWAVNGELDLIADAAPYNTARFDAFCSVLDLLTLTPTAMPDSTDLAGYGDGTIWLSETGDTMFYYDADEPDSVRYTTPATLFPSKLATR